MMKKVIMLVALAAMVASATAGHLVTPGAINPVTSNVYVDADRNIIEDVTWTQAMSPIHLDGVIYVAGGKTLTIEAGVVVASFVADSGSLAVTRGAKIFVNGTQDEPVIMTSANDVATWAGSVVTTDVNGDVTAITTVGDPKTGTWRGVCTEWGSLAIMGKGYLSGSHYGGVAPANEQKWTDSLGVVHTNTRCPGDNRKVMEGLTTVTGFPERALYGGEDDNDDSGSISYLSLRYGGKLGTDPNKELNGLSLGAVGRATDISYVDIMNNVDDGIEIWGGTVNLDHVSIWNIGDDSFDLDEGWRGSAEYGIIVQGYSQKSIQGSGLGDNCFEVDGAEAADAQPMTTAKISKFTVVGNDATPITAVDPVYGTQTFSDDGDAGTAWRDNARVQYVDCIWTNIGADLIAFDENDGDGQLGYDGVAGSASKTTAADGTMSWKEHWENSYNQWKAGTKFNNITSCTVADAVLEALYESYMTQDVNGKLCQITDSVFYFPEASLGSVAEETGVINENPLVTGYNEAQALTNMIVPSLPIQELQVGPKEYWIAFDKTTMKKLVCEPVTFLNPCPVDGITAGAFTGCENWLEDWTAAFAFGMTNASSTLSADTNCDGAVDLTDLSTMSTQWLQ